MKRFHVSDCVFTARMSKLFVALVALSIAYSVQGKYTTFYINIHPVTAKCEMGNVRQLTQVDRFIVLTLFVLH